LIAFLADLLQRVLQYLVGWFVDYPHWAPFIVLLLCGIGLPMPEEVTLIGCGFLCHKEKVDFLWITLVCTAAIIGGDSIPYWLGRRYGLAALKLKWVARILHPERFAELERRFAENGNWAVFTLRFLPGLRLPGYFVAGTLRMSYTRFFLLDMAGVAISVPTSIWIAWKVFDQIGDDLAAAAAKVSSYNHTVLYSVLALVVSIFAWRWWRRRKTRMAAEGERR
jgi:membrane protein DedA with SNARE-associated domain